MARFLKAAVHVLLIVISSPATADEGASGLYVRGNFGSALVGEQGREGKHSGGNACTGTSWLSHSSHLLAF